MSPWAAGNTPLMASSTATAVLMAATVLQVAFTYALTREFEKRLVWLLLAVVVFGGATLVFRNQMFIQWKPTIFNWVLAVAFGGSQFVGDKNLMERTLGSQIHLPKPCGPTQSVVGSQFCHRGGTQPGGGLRLQ